MALPSRNKSAGGLGGEEVDSYFDLRLARRWKRRGIVYGNLGINASRETALKKTVLCDNGNNEALVEVVTIDSDDGQLLDGMQLSVDFDGNDDGDAFDPQYKMFLDNLKEDGKSYLLELALVNKTSVVVKYEEDGSTSKVDVDKLETIMCHQKQGQIRTGDALKRQPKREKIEPLRLNLKRQSKREKIENSERGLRSSLRRERSKSRGMVLSSNSQRKNNENPRTKNDVVEKVKTAIPRILRSNSRRKNYKRSSNGDYENPNIMNDVVTNVQTAIPRILRSNSRRENYKSSSNGDYENPSIMNDVVKKVQTGKLRILRNNSRSENYKSSRNGDACSSKRHSSKAANAARHQWNHGVDSDVDESYLEFLKLIEGGPDNLVWRPEGGKKVVYAKSDSDSEAEQEAEGPVSSAENGYPRKRHIPEAANAKSLFNHGRKCDLDVESYQEILKSWKDVEHCDSEIEAEEEAEDLVSPAEKGMSMIRHCRKAFNSANHQSNQEEKSHSVDESYLEFLKFVKNGRHMEWTPEGGKRIIYEESDYDSEAGAGQEAEDPVSSENGCSSKSQNPEATNSAKHQCNHGVISDLVDQNYEDFLKFAKNGQHLEYTPEGGEKVTYEESDSDSEVMILDNNLFSDGKPTPVDFVDLDGEECIENHSKDSAFRVELMEILRRPYDVLEFEKLWQNASYKSPLQGVRVLRKQDKSYPLPYHCRSYLDVYSDLASVISHSQPDKLSILNLLRGFFYWLQNVAREGSFKPWLDSSCLSALPPVPPTASTTG